MYLVIFILHNPDLLEELLEAWDSAGVTGATVLFSTGMEKFRQQKGIRDDIPLIPSLNDFYAASETMSRTVLTAVKSEALIDKIASVTQKLVGDLNKPDSGLLLVMPIARAYGLDRGQEK